jgi:hypothetical protein
MAALTGRAASWPGGVSKSTVQRILAQAKLQPQRLDRYMASQDPDFEAKAADIIGLYLNPPQHAVLNVKTGRVAGKTARRHTSGEFVGFARQSVGAQNADGRAVPGRASEGAISLHTDLLVLVESGGDLVCQDRAVPRARLSSNARRS